MILIILLLILTACTNVDRGSYNPYMPSDDSQEQADNESPKEIPYGDDALFVIHEFTVTINHNGYSQNMFVVNKGELARFLAVAAPGTSGHMHGITIDEFNVNEAVTTTDEPKVIEFVANQSGTFNIYCKTCWDGPFGRGHPDIKATLVVEDSTVECKTEQDCIDSGKCSQNIECSCINNRCNTGFVAAVE